MAEKYDLIFSLGAMPVISQMLRDNELQIFDFPFDRVSGSDFLTRMSLLLLDCNNFIEQKNIVEQKDTPREGLTQYKDIKTNFIYPFDFNPAILIENNYPAVKARYDRYIKNLRLCINAAKKILIVYVENPQMKEDDSDTSELVLEASQKLKQKYPNKDFRIMYAKNDEDSENMKVIEIGKNAEKLVFNFYKKFSDVSSSFIDVSMLSMIFTDIELKKSWKMKKMFFLQKLLNQITSFRNELH